MKNKKVSICIPVYNSEPYLESCLKSVKNQTFTDYEVIVVNDGSQGTNEQGENCKKIIKKLKKECKLAINYIEHSENKGLLEARRTGIYASKGDYIFNLDSDDKLPPNAIEVLYKTAIETNADIVHGNGELFESDCNDSMVKAREEKIEKVRAIRREKIKNVYFGELTNDDILNGYLVEKNHCGFLWGKLFKRELYLDAFDKIPPMFCTMAEDVIQYFWISFFAKKYVGIRNCVYYYCDDTGITSNRVVDKIEKWEQVCSVASVFTAIYTSLRDLNIELEKSQKEKLSLLCCNYVANNLLQLKQAVVPELQDQAYQVLKDYWGEDFVLKVSKRMKNSDEDINSSEKI